MQLSSKDCVCTDKCAALLLAESLTGCEPNTKHADTEHLWQLPITLMHSYTILGLLLSVKGHS